MDLRDIDSLSFSGEGLTVEERAGLEVAFAKRKSEESLTSVHFWGKVKGTENDYLVAQGNVASKAYPEKKFYFCTSKSFVLQAVPTLTPEFEEKAAADKSRLKGDPSAGAGEEEEEEEEDKEEEEGAPKKVRYDETFRLAYAIKQIDTATSVVPRGAYIVSATHDVLRNTAFQGLDAASASNLDSYFHFREPTALPRKTALERSGMVRSVDFLDSLAEDKPLGVWAARVNNASGVATLRSLLFPGYFFYHEVGTGRFGGAYFGYGQVNQDVGFML